LAAHCCCAYFFERQKSLANYRYILVLNNVIEVFKSCASQSYFTLYSVHTKLLSHDIIKSQPKSSNLANYLNYIHHFISSQSQVDVIYFIFSSVFCFVSHTLLYINTISHHIHSNSHAVIRYNNMQTCGKTPTCFSHLQRGI
jgi:hypothetical protein